MKHFIISSFFRFFFSKKRQTNSIVIDCFKMRIGFRMGIVLLLSLYTADLLAVVNVTTSLNVSVNGNTDYIIQTGGTLHTNGGGGGQTVATITVQPGGQLDVASGNPLTVTGALQFESDASSTFSAIIDATVTCSSTVKYKKYGMTSADWYFMSFPYQVSAIDRTFGTEILVKSYNTVTRSNNGIGGGAWENVSACPLTARLGYAVGIKTGQGPFDVTFTLNTASLAVETGNILEAVDGTNRGGQPHQGWNLLGQPFLSKLAETGINTTYINTYNTGSATYTQTATASGGLVLSPMTCLFVQVSADGNVTFAQANRSLVRAGIKNDLTDRIRLNIVNAAGSDNTNLIIDPTQSTSYEIGQDLLKMSATGYKPQIYSSLDGLDYAFNALPLESIQDLPLRVYSQTADSATISADMTAAPGISQLLLTDNTTNTTTDLTLSSYRYLAAATTETGRFVLRAQNVATSINEVSRDNRPIISTKVSCILLTDIRKKTKIRVLDAMGRLVVTKETVNKSVEIPFAVKGIYVIQLQSGIHSWSEKIAIH